MSKAGGGRGDRSEGKLSGMGRALEQSLKRMLTELESTVEVEKDGAKKQVAKYTLLDKLRVYDRALKLEAIRHKMTDDEGGFFGNGQGGSDE